MRFLAVFKGAAGAIALAAFSFPAAAQPLDPETMLPGWWGWEPHEDDPEGRTGLCSNLPMRIWFTEGGERYNAQWESQIESGDISTSPIYARLPSTETSAGFVIRYDGEERLDEDGNPVSWVLLMLSADRFVWVRNDWVGTGGATRAMVRCDPAPIG